MASSSAPPATYDGGPPGAAVGKNALAAALAERRLMAQELLSEADRELGLADTMRARLRGMIGLFLTLLLLAIAVAVWHVRTAYAELYDLFAKGQPGGLGCGADLVQLSPTKIALSIEYPPLARWLPSPLAPPEALFLLLVVREKRCPDTSALCGPLLAFEGDARAATRRLMPWAEFEAKICCLCQGSDATACSRVTPGETPPQQAGCGASQPSASCKYRDWLRAEVAPDGNYPDSAALLRPDGEPLVPISACIMMDYYFGKDYAKTVCPKEHGSALVLQTFMRYGFGGFARAFMGDDERTPVQAWSYFFESEWLTCTAPPKSARATGILSGIMNGGFFGQFIGDALAFALPEIGVPLQVAAVAGAAAYGGVAANEAADDAQRGMCQEDGEAGYAPKNPTCSVQ